MGTFRTNVEIENPRWHFRQADGTVLSRWTGAVSLTVAGQVRDVAAAR